LDTLSFPDLAGLFLLAGANFLDIRKKRIPNELTVPLALLGLGYHMVTRGVLKGVVFSATGGATGLSLLFIPFTMGWMGGGDVKLLAALGFWTGIRDIINIFLFGAMAGGVISLVMIMISEGEGYFGQGKVLLMDLFRFFSGEKKGEFIRGPVLLPYSLPISIGYIAILVGGDIF